MRRRLPVALLAVIVLTATSLVRHASTAVPPPLIGANYTHYAYPNCGLDDGIIAHYHEPGVRRRVRARGRQRSARWLLQPGEVRRELAVRPRCPAAAEAIRAGLDARRPPQRGSAAKLGERDESRPGEGLRHEDVVELRPYFRRRGRNDLERRCGRAVRHRRPAPEPGRRPSCQRKTVSALVRRTSALQLRRDALGPPGGRRDAVGGRPVAAARDRRGGLQR